MYQYRLLGVHNEWNNTTHKHFQFASLEPGNYTFEFRAKRNNSSWSQPASISFHVIVPLWEKPIVIVLYFVVLLIFITIVIIWRSKVKHAKKLAILEQSYQVKSLEQKAL